jgi:hypothetical protein
MTSSGSIHHHPSANAAAALPLLREALAKLLELGPLEQ